MSSRPCTMVRPPLALDVLLELNAEGAVVPGGAVAAVDLARWIDEASPLAQADERVDAIGGHGKSPSGWGRERERKRREPQGRGWAGGRRGGLGEEEGGKTNRGAGQWPTLLWAAGGLSTVVVGRGSRVVEVEGR